MGTAGTQLRIPELVRKSCTSGSVYAAGTYGYTVGTADVLSRCVPALYPADQLNGYTIGYI